MKCWKRTCDEFTVMHLGFLDYAHYIVTVRFYGLESFEKRYHITDLRFFVSAKDYLDGNFIWPTVIFLIAVQDV